jgi:hypothetical protein
MSIGNLRSAAAPAMLLSVLTLLVAACASNHERVADHLLERGSTIERNAPLGGESLSVRKHEVKRAYRDLIHYRDTFETLRRRRDGNGLTLFRQFAEDYMDTHLQPILDADWQSDHPELLGLDANIRLVQAECYMLMSKPGKMQKVLNEIEDRYAGRETMLVDYPIGEQSTLEEAIENISDRKWD